MTDVQSTEQAATNPSPRQVTVQNSQVGVIGDHTTVHGGINYYQIAPPANPTEARNRAAMLQLVHNTWIKGYFEQSLHGAVLLELGKEYHPNAVERPWDMVLYMPERPEQTVPKGTKMLDILDQMSGSLLILGDPGSGKTFTLLELARDAIARAQADPTQPIPVIFNLSSWAAKRQPIDKWVVDEMRSKYRVPRKLAEEWVKNDILLLLLDGLDEVNIGRRYACVEAINTFRSDHGFASLVVCSRIVDYKMLTAQLKIQAAIQLQPLTDGQIEQYIAGSGAESEAILISLKHDAVLKELARSPLTLNVMTLTYRGSSLKDMSSLPTTSEARRQHLFDAYIRRMLKRRSKVCIFSDPSTVSWLSWTAGQMSTRSQTIFLIESLQPDWLPDRQRRLLNSMTPLIVGMFVGLVVGMFFGVDAGFFWGFIGTLAGGLVRVDKIGLVEAVVWSWEEMYVGLFIGLAVGLIIGLVVGLIVGVNVRLAAGLANGLSLWLIITLIGGAIGGIKTKSLETKAFPNQGIGQSAKNGWVGGLVGGLGVGLFGGLVLLALRLVWVLLRANLKINVLGIFFWGLVAGLGFGLYYGELAVIRHFILRYFLHRAGLLPFRLVPFLDYCVERIFLRRVGGGYIFIHRMLQEHFAALTPERQREIVEGIESQ
ncbi:MAG: hypothetical protein JXA14_27365 [Anaerolineae bacterium]|nr:hypothetical protein [Anaerolineae bacterium]